MSPRKAFVMALLPLVAVWILVFHASLSVPMVGVRYAPCGENLPGVRVDNIDNDVINIDLPTGCVTGFIDRRGHYHDFHPDILIEEPDMLGSYENYFAFMDQQGLLAEVLESGALTLVAANNDRITLTTHSHSIFDLSGMFWYQGVFMPLAALMIAAAVWSFRQRSAVAISFLVSAFSIALAIAVAAAYGTRELALPAWEFRLLSLLNNLGALFFTAAFLGVIWLYPRPLGGLWLPALAYLVAGLVWLSDVLVLTDELATNHAMAVLLLFAPTFPLAAVQWFRTRRHPVERASLLWFLFSMFLGTSLFAGLSLIPSALGMEPLASQGMLFVVFLFIFAGLAFGILRFRLFDLDLWWFRFWGWVLGGLCVIALDLVLVSVLGMQQSGALPASLAVMGWIYFPLRQWLWAWLRPVVPLEQRLSGVVRDVIGVSDADALVRLWPQLLQKQFQALEVRALDGPAASSRIASDGQTLFVTALHGDCGYAVSYPDKGARLFSRDDLGYLQLIEHLVGHALESLLQRDAAIQGERERIMQDLHDDLGAKLTSLIYRAGSLDNEELARSAVRDMRDILTDLQASPCSLEAALLIWRDEVDARLAGTGIGLQWQQAALLDPGVSLSARQRTNISRILREALTNAIRHGDHHTIVIAAAQDEGTLTLRMQMLSNNGESVLPDTWQPGTGLRGMERRAAAIQARLDWEASEQGPVLTLCLPG